MSSLFFLFLFVFILYTTLIISAKDELNYTQKDYRLINDRLTIDKVVPEWVTYTAINRMYNRTTRVFDVIAKINKDFHPTNVTLSVLAHRKINNVYKPFAAIRLKINACDALKKNYFGIAEWKNKIGNFTDCPIKKGTCVLHDYVPDENKMPPYVPVGSYRIEIRVYSAATHVGTISWYGSIVNKNKLE